MPASAQENTRSFSLPSEVVRYLDSLPKRQRSKFVSSHLSRIVRQLDRDQFLETLDSIVPIDDGDPRPSEELVQEARQQRIERITNTETHE